MTLALAAALIGCGKHEPRHFVILPDLSGSIERESLQQAFKGIDELAGHLQRGDTLTLIPILGDAEAEASGKIMRFEVPANRQAYDTDLRDFRSKLSLSLKAMERNAIASPESKTDILGSVLLAQREHKLQPSWTKTIIFVLTDLVQEDGELDFRTDRRLRDEITAQKLATEYAEATHADFRNTVVYLGQLRSHEFAHLTRSKRRAIRLFWTRFFTNAGTSPNFSADGPGLFK